MLERVRLCCVYVSVLNVSSHCSECGPVTSLSCCMHHSLCMLVIVCVCHLCSCKPRLLICSSSLSVPATDPTWRTWLCKCLPRLLQQRRQQRLHQHLPAASLPVCSAPRLLCPLRGSVCSSQRPPPFLAWGEQSSHRRHRALQQPRPLLLGPSNATTASQWALVDQHKVLCRGSRR